MLFVTENERFRHFTGSSYRRLKEAKPKEKIALIEVNIVTLDLLESMQEGYNLGLSLVDQAAGEAAVFVTEHRIWDPALDGLKAAGMSLARLGWHDVYDSRKYWPFNGMFIKTVALLHEESVAYAGESFCVYGYDQEARIFSEKQIKEYQEVLILFLKEKGREDLLTRKWFSPHKTFW